MLKTTLLILMIATSVNAQSWQTISTSNLTFIDLTGTGQQSPPSGQSYFNLYLPLFSLPSTQPAFTACALSDLQFNTYNIFLTDAGAAHPFTWAFVPSGTYSSYPLVSPAQFYVSNYKSWINGVEYDGSLGGSIVHNSDPDADNSSINSAYVGTGVVQSVFAHSRRCYDGGPEFGFYRYLSRPPRDFASPNNNITDADQIANRVYFYYSALTNCIGATPHTVGGSTETQTNCKNPETGQFTSDLVNTRTPPTNGILIHWPKTTQYQANSCSGTTRYDWKYRAEAVDASSFKITVVDPCSGAAQSIETDDPGTSGVDESKYKLVTVKEWFRPYTAQMYYGGLWAYTTAVTQKSMLYEKPSSGSPYETRGDLTCTGSDCDNLPALGLVSLGVKQADALTGKIPDLEPSSWEGTETTFTATYYTPSSLSASQLLINYDLNGDNACYITYVPGSTGTNELNLVNDDGPDHGYVTLTVGQPSGSIANSQCTLYSNGSSIQQKGRETIIKARIGFKPAFAGARSVYAGVQSSAGNSNWQPVGAAYVSYSSPPSLVAKRVTHSETGSWLVDVDNGGTCTDGATPPNAIPCLAPIALRANFDSTSTVNGRQVLINHTVDGVGACHFTTDGTSTFYLYTDNGMGTTSTTLSSTPGASVFLENSQCKVTFYTPLGSNPLQNSTGYKVPPQSANGVSGSTYWFQATVQPKAAFISGNPGSSAFHPGALMIYTAAQTSGGNTGWQPTGHWRIQ